VSQRSRHARYAAPEHHRRKPRRRALRTPVTFAGDSAREAVGQPGLAALIAEAMAMDVDLFVCQSGLALAGMTANDLVPQVRAAGLISFLADARADDRLLVY
jgi:predicted peroxiredoxin